MSTTTAAFNPMDHRIAMELKPVWLTRVSGWLGHVPFAYALIDMARPSTLVELGTHTGVSYIAFCQAVASLGLSTRCTAIDTWEGDPQTGAYGPEVLAELRLFHDASSYARFSTLLQSTFDDALARFPDGSIDLLHIDGFHSYAAVKHDFETWLPKLSPRGVILFHDTADRSAGVEVWRLWSEITAGRPNFEFLHSAGLGVLAVGSDPPPKVLHFLDAATADPSAPRLFFSTLGATIDRFRLLRYVMMNIRELQIDIDNIKRSAGYPVVTPTLKQYYEKPSEMMGQFTSEVRKILSSVQARPHGGATPGERGSWS